MSNNGGYPHVPRRAGLPREVLRWIQSLDLTFPIKNLRRDFSNGLLIAEIFYWYFQDDIQMHGFENGCSIETKLSNWSQLERFFSKRNLDISRELIDGTIHCKPGAAEIILQTIYVMLTNRKIKTIQEHDIDFTDQPYQELLPMLARSTATRSVKNNITLSELLIEPDVVINKRKVQNIIDLHLQQRKSERIEDPDRFDVKPTLGELAVRLTVLPLQPDARGRHLSISPFGAGAEIRRKHSVNFKELPVKQSNRPSNFSATYRSRSASIA